MDVIFFASLAFLTAVTGLICWRRNPMLAGRPHLRMHLLSATGVATLTALAVYLVGMTVDRSPATLGVTAAEGVVVGIAGLMSLRVRARHNGRRLRNMRRKLEA
jgi:hypothetical protein